jgi:N-formylglutamate amidohydrolase
MQLSKEFTASLSTRMGVPIEELSRRPFVLREPENQAVPFIFASPHSGRCYPSDFVGQSRLSPLDLRRSEDAFVDELFASVVDVGAPLLAACFPRAYLDVNRAPTEIDSAMFDGPLKMASDMASPRVNAGLGVIPRIVRDGAEIYRGKLPASEVADRFALFYRPYHATLSRLVETTRRRFGIAILVDCHSMPSAAAAPDIVLGDRYGLSAGSGLMRQAESSFEAQGFRVARNIPYAGGFTTQVYGNPAKGVHALQIEVNRALYLDEEQVERSARFGEIAFRIGIALGQMSHAKGLSAQNPTLKHAAE